TRFSASIAIRESGFDRTHRRRDRSNEARTCGARTAPTAGVSGPVRPSRCHLKDCLSVTKCPRYSWKMGRARSWAAALGALGLVALLAGCEMSRQAGAAIDAGRRSTQQGDLLQALEHYRTATRLAPDSATAQLALAEAAEALGEFDE